MDKKAVPAIRAQAQGFLVLMTYGLGMFIGAQVSGWIFNAIVIGSGPDAMIQWQNFWITPAAFAAIVMVFFAIMFNEKKTENSN